MDTNDTENPKPEGAPPETGGTGETPPEEPVGAGLVPAQDLAAELERTRAALKAANAESAARRKKLEAFEAFSDELDRVKAELAATKAEAETAKANTRAAAIKHAVESAAAALHFQDPADALTLADLSGVQVSEDGAVAGAAEAVKALADKRPYLLKPAGDGLGTPKRQPAQKPPATDAKPGAPLVRL